MKTMRLYLLFSTSLILVFSNLFNIGAEAPRRAKIVFTSARNTNAEIYIVNNPKLKHGACAKRIPNVHSTS